MSPISDKNERNDSHTQRGSHVANKPHEPRPDSHPANKPWESRPDTRDVRERSLSPPDPPHLKALNPVGRTGSFIKNRDSPRRQSREIKDLDPAEIGHSGQPRYPSGTPPGTLSDLKKQRSENHKMGNGLDAQVQNLFLHSLSGAGNKYSSGSSSSSHPPQTHKRESTQNGRNVKNNNNNTSGPSRPPTFISDSGPLRKFSAPTSHPVIGEDDKFKNNCCVILWSFIFYRIVIVNHSSETFAPEVWSTNPFPATRDNCRLHPHLMTYFGSLFCKHTRSG